MEDYNKIIESLGISYINARNLVVANPVCISSFKDVGSTIVMLHNGDFHAEGEKIENGGFLFIPGGKTADLCFGDKNSPKVKHEDFITDSEKYIKTNAAVQTFGKLANSHSLVSFDAKIFDAVSYFTALDIPPFVIEPNSCLGDCIIRLLKEVNSNKVGKERIVNTITEQIVIEIIRYILEKQLFLEQLATNTTYFKDPRLIDIFKFIKQNLGGDLSNKVLSNVANVSEDYVGQYFKMLTGINPQDYIEYQRMEEAVQLLRTTKKSVRDIGREIGYKDTAYFCRRFKMMFGIPAGKMRRREN